jgi:hypothetical protein
MELPWVYQQDPLARIGREPSFNLRLQQAGPSASRHNLESFIQARFAESYNARVTHFMPCLLALETPAGLVRGAVGLRGAENRELFLERYLDLPIEQAIEQRSGRRLLRREIVEVGNLAASSPGAARLLIVALTDLLVAQGFRWVAFTGTSALLNSFQRLGLAPLGLGPADPLRLGEERNAWGSYYDCQPQVTVGEIAGGHQCLLQQGAYARLGYQPLYGNPEMAHVACS